MKARNKAQVSIFFILAIVVLIVLLLLFFILSKDYLIKLIIKETKHPMQYYVEECLKVEMVDAVENLSSQGGFIYDYQYLLSTTKQRFAYSIYYNGSNSVNTSPSLEFMESEISRYIEENINGCIDQAQYRIEKGTPKATTIIFPESISVKLHYPMTLQEEDLTYNFDYFYKRHMLPLGRIITLRDQVVADMLQYPNLMLLDKLYDTDLEMIINPLSGRVKIIDAINYSTRLRNSPLKFSFAVYDLHELPDELEITTQIPNITIASGQILDLQIRCQPTCKFYDNTILFEIDERLGTIHYEPDALDIGEYNITITAFDETYKVSKVFNLKVT
jgi:hypothetical protein